ncbi:MAG: 2-amino-4-hydroxy-6-hydroxymethyldihydropteridine diphosphokinase [Myxococcales bacterium]|nr:2-amino-4-hydroxy-6-hydroxymethyldihydropteridine diphosphokinase [Myxococcales bacterium]
MNELIIGLGGNLGTDDQLLARFDDVAADLARRGRVRASGVYRSDALVAGDPPFLNAALAVTPDERLAPEEVLALTQALEQRHGRRREVEPYWGPRTLDLDLLVWGKLQHRTPTLRIPHPRVHQRSFTLRPMIDLLGGDFVIPGHHETLTWLAHGSTPPIVPTDLAIVIARPAGP